MAITKNLNSSTLAEMNTMAALEGGTPFLVNANSSDASGNEELVAAPATGKAIYLEDVLISSSAAISIVLNEATSAVSGPFYSTAEGLLAHKLYKRPIKLKDATALNVDASGAGAVTLIIEGFIA